MIDTGSGLSYKTELSARANRRDPARGRGRHAERADRRHRARVSRGLPRVAVGGRRRWRTLRGRFHNALRGKLSAKTGTLSNVIALSGFLEAAPGQHLAFALITNGNRRGDHRAIRVARRNQVVGLLYDYAAAVAKTAPTRAPSEAAPIAPVAAPGDDPPATTRPMTRAAPPPCPDPLARVELGLQPGRTTR